MRLLSFRFMQIFSRKDSSRFFHTNRKILHHMMIHSRTVFKNKARQLFYLYLSRFSLILIFQSAAIIPIDLPKEPNSPNVPDVTDKTDKDARGEKKKNSKEIKIRLCDNREVKGLWESDKEEISFSHNKEGIIYSKKIKFSEVSAIKIVTWEGKFIKRKSDGKLFKMLPKKVEIISGTTRFMKEGLLEFAEFSIQNENGSAKLYTYWMDSLSDTGKWYSNLPAFSGAERKECHADVVREVFF